MLDPRSHRFLDAKFKRARYVWWRYVVTRRHPTLHPPRSYAEHLARVRLQRAVRECGHENRRPNPAASAVLDRNPEVCVDCGTGIVTHRRPRPGA